MRYARPIPTRRFNLSAAPAEGLRGDGVVSVAGWVLIGALISDLEGVETVAVVRGDGEGRRDCWLEEVEKSWDCARIGSDWDWE